jgi:hypothetical protein
MIVVLVVVIACAIGYLVYRSSQPDWVEPKEPPPSEAELLQARLDLHRIERGVDVTLAREEAHRLGEQTKQSIADALDDQR